MMERLHRGRTGQKWVRRSVPLCLLCWRTKLDVDWKRVKIDQAIGDKRYGDQNTDGSHSIRSF